MMDPEFINYLAGRGFTEEEYCNLPAQLRVSMAVLFNPQKGFISIGAIII